MGEIPLAQGQMAQPAPAAQAAEIVYSPAAAATVGASAPELQRNHMPAQKADGPTPAGSDASQDAGKSSELAGKIFDASTLKRRPVTSNIRPAVQTPAANLASTGMPPADAQNGQSAGPSFMSPFEQTSGPQRELLGPQASLRPDPLPLMDAPPPATATGEAAAGTAGPGPISDMERDFSVTESMIDAENIGAEEVPELPLSDTTHFDIDIDDPGGQVRLDLTRQAEEVAIRLETPEEILEEYRDLEKDIEDALEEAGLSLADYEATTDRDQQERSDRELRERTSSGSQDRESGAEEAPKRGRLLNRIV